MLCCVFRPAFGCCIHPKAGQNTFFQPFSTFFVNTLAFGIDESSFKYKMSSSNVHEVCLLKLTLNSLVLCLGLRPALFWGFYFFSLMCVPFPLVQFVSQNITKNTENEDFNQHLGCATPKHWSKYTTPSKKISWKPSKSAQIASSLILNFIDPKFLSWSNLLASKRRITLFSKGFRRK